VTDPARTWLIIAAMGAITVGIRLSMILLLGRVAVPAAVSRALRFVPPAVFSALVAPALLRPSGALDLSWANPHLLAGALAAAVAWRGRNVFLTIGAGMAALWILR